MHGEAAHAALNGAVQKVRRICEHGSGRSRGMDPTELAAAIKPLNQAASMPAGFYTDPAVFAAEREHTC